MKKDIGVYIHIPFCKKKCSYCDFISFAGKEEVIESYVEAIIREIKDTYTLENYNIKTVYIGGGTPSILKSEYIGKILKSFSFSENAEVTIEVNPGTVTKEKLEDYIKFGINRLSIGLQSTSNVLLKQIGRIHNYSEFLNTYEIARRAGFKNINVDLMLGLPNQTLSNLQRSLREVISLEPEHISIYSLILEDGTKLEKQIQMGKFEMPSEELERTMYWKTKKMLEESGYIHYEISNFAKDGFMSQHNLDCWNQKEYIGFGLSAHSYLECIRFSNITNLEEYLKNINIGDFGKNKIIHERQTNSMTRIEFMLLGLRKIDGVSISDYKNKFGDNPLFIYNKEIAKLVDEDLLEIDGNYIRLTKKGLDFANIVWEEFV